ncbi:MAG: SDR family oxidoreductase [Rhodospirillaceae bacterium]|nr:SDR family oxidoreductase [Rhodospirillaceae bacterium]MBT3887117.1 SDR family oxidoreductase [Rhodospirillaceae bacterium]MBT4117391.1 SDR family oxidoreductase [Rhodospirillaceae bacterium]MBT4671802.1 SDR family oxidoreductase [Rhodospirillaceae bacterium]MBT4720418.1 SDR family oxidoreductase [Rhodospirillaceae bacterium]
MDAARVLVTAGAAGIGLAVAERFQAAGAKVIVCDIDAGALETVPPELKVVQCDVADTDQVAGLFEKVRQDMGGLDVLINNAGIGGGQAAIEDITDAAWQRTLDVNLSGMFYCLRAAVPGMKAQGSGAVINIATASVRTGLPGRMPYVASKQGVMGLTHNAARELGPDNIRCNAILPGLVDNARGRNLVAERAKDRGISAAEVEDDYLRYVSMRCWIDPAEVGDLAVFLASGQARHISGQFIAVDGHMEWES